MGIADTYYNVTTPQTPAPGRTTTAFNDIASSVPGFVQGVKDAVSWAWEGLDEYPEATKWISAIILGIGTYAIGGSAIKSLLGLANMDSPWLVTPLTLALTAAVAFGGSNALANKGADKRVQWENEAAERRGEQIRRMEAQINPGGVPDLNSSFTSGARNTPKPQTPARTTIEMPSGTERITQTTPPATSQPASPGWSSRLPV